MTLAKFTSGFIAVGMILGACGAELVRGSIRAVPRLVGLVGGCKTR